MELGSPALSVRSLSHWTTRQVSLSLFLKKKKIFYFIFMRTDILKCKMYSFNIYLLSTCSMPGDPWSWEYKPAAISKISALEHLNVYQQRVRERKRKKVLLGEGNYKTKEANYKIKDFAWQCPHACMPSHLSHVQLFATVWTVACQNTGVGCDALLQEIFLIQGLNPCLLSLLHWQEGSLSLVPPEKQVHKSFQKALTVESWWKNKSS